MKDIKDITEGKLFRWVKASERLPESTGYYIVLNANATTFSDAYRTQYSYEGDGEFWARSGKQWLEEVPVPHSETGDKAGYDFKKMFVCPSCGGDGKETCNNPDHGFIGAVGGEIGRLGCPVCGHDENFKVNRGRNKCEWCSGTGFATPESAEEFVNGSNFDDELQEVIVAFPKKLNVAPNDEPSVATVDDSSNVADPTKKESETSEGKEDLVLPKLKPLKVNWREHATRYLTNALWLNLTKTNEVLGYFSQYFDSKSEGKQGEE